MGRRRCPRSFMLLAEGGVRVRWACGAERDVPTEAAVDVDILADHLGDLTHHHRHHHHKE